jgi:epoxyqueuosine reductase
MQNVPDWPVIQCHLEATGWTSRVVPVERLTEVTERATSAAASGDLPPAVAAELAESIAFQLPNEPSPLHSVLVAASSRPLTQALLTHDGEERLVRVPPHYAGYRTLPDELAAEVGAALRPLGYGAARCAPPLKTLAACAGLARYGRNNIVYVEGLGSYIYLAACATDAPPPADHFWSYPVALDRCSTCGACSKACPTRAIGAERFLLHTDRCLTYHNESTEPFPGWIKPDWHHVAVGCLRCQAVCPVNTDHGPRKTPPERFDERETAAILAATPIQELPTTTRHKMQRCGLDYSPQLIARNLRALLDATPS